MARGTDDDGRIDGVGIHAALVVVVHRDERPVGHDARDADRAVRLVAARDQVLDRRGVEELHVRERDHLGEQRRREQRRVLDHHVGALVFEGDPELGEELVGRLAHDHRAEELAAEPGAAACGGGMFVSKLLKCRYTPSSSGWKVLRTRRDASLNDGDLKVGTGLGESVGRAQTTGAGADDDDVGLGVGVEVCEVATDHSTSDLGLADGLEAELLPLAVADGEVLTAVGVGLVDLAIANGDATLVGEGGGLNDFDSRGCHCVLLGYFGWD